ncbi:MAG: hypothetical protein OXC48_04115, partial [Endozoicomonadaceae bacterium]|nr:hypothetical protein [Endozoicomonadaceae bacterium]
RLEQQNGYGVTFHYVQGTHLLREICDDQNHKIVLTREAGSLIITSYDSVGRPVNIYLYSPGGKLKKISLPRSDEQSSSDIHMNYAKNLLISIVYPTGMKKSMIYNCTDAMKVSSFYGHQQKGVCVVTWEGVYPGANQPEMVTRYCYSKSNANEHNYLAFNSGLNLESQSRADVLFETPATYTYKTIQDNGITQQIRTYNKYHLLIDAQIVSDKTHHVLSKVHNFFCNTNQVDGCASTRFEDLPSTYSLPLKTVMENWGDSSGAPATEVTERSYDSMGRVTRTKDAYGRVKEIKYCPSGGDSACPAEPDGWSSTTQVESVISYPSAQVPGAALLPVIKQYSFYQKEFNPDRKGYILVLAQKTVDTGDQNMTTTRQYYDNPQDIFRYGLLKRLTVKGTVSSAANFTSVNKNYYYILSSDHKTKETYTTVETGKNQFEQSSVITTSMYTNQVLRMADAENKDISYYHYDNQGRLVQTDSAVGTDFMVSKHYQYIISPQQVELITMAANGLKEKMLFDGTGRKLAKFKQVIADTGKMESDQWMLVKRTNYDAYGRVSSEDSYYADATGKLSELTTTFEYDDLGRVYKVHLPDKETVVKMYDDPDRCEINYKYDSQNHYSSISVVHGNILEKPIEQMILPANFNHHLSAKQLCAVSSKLPVAKVSFVTYDGFGKLTTSVDAMGRKVSREYDSVGRVSTIVDPEGDKIHNVYNLTGKIIQKWVLPFNSHKQYLLASAQYNAAGEMLWKVNESGEKTQYTYTTDGQTKTVTTPSGHIISWQYNVIGLPVNKMIDGKQIVHLEYNPVITLPDKRIDITGVTTWNYSDDGKTQQLIHNGAKGYQSYYFKWQYDKNRKLVSITDLSGNKTITNYGDFDRIKSIFYQNANDIKKLLQTFGYDDFSRVVSLEYGSGMHRAINYDNYGHTDNISDTLANGLLSEWKYTYDKEGNIIVSTHSNGKHQQVTEKYKYDSLDNLVSMTCSGSSVSSLCPRDTSFHGQALNQAPIITSQSYSFNALNRMTTLRETLLNPDKQQTLNKIVNYSYTDVQAPLRLQKITTAWNNKAAIATNFAYDNAGNMLADGEGNKITYNVLNQITSVIDLQGKQTHYFYDGTGRETKETSSSGENRSMFYMGKALAMEKISNAQMDTHIISHLGVAKAIDGMIHEYYEKNYKGDVTGVLTKTASNIYVLNHYNVYSPYGMVWHTRSVVALPWYLQTSAGFDGEYADPATGWQFLDAGHRTYNPQQRYFLSEDPAGDGYAFGSNNPIMNSDPSGNMPKWLGHVMHVLSYVGTMGMIAFHKKWANAIGVALVTALVCTVVVAAMLYAVAAVPVILVTAGAIIAAGSLAVASAAVPTNKGLSIASAVVGVASLATVVATGGITIFTRLSQILTVIGDDIASVAGDGVTVAGDEVAASSFDGYSIEPSEADSLGGEVADKAGAAATKAPAFNPNNSKMYQELKIFANDENEIEIKNSNTLQAVFRPITKNVQFFRQEAFVILNQARVLDQPIKLDTFAEFLDMDAEYGEGAPDRLLALHEALFKPMDNANPEEAVDTLVNKEGSVFYENRLMGKSTFWVSDGNHTALGISFLQRSGVAYTESRNLNSLLEEFAANLVGETFIVS